MYEDKTNYSNIARKIFADLDEEYEKLEEGEPVLEGSSITDVASVIKEQIDEGNVSSVIISVALKNGMCCYFSSGGESRLELIGLAKKTLSYIEQGAGICHSKTGKYM